MFTKELGIIGIGNMGTALLRGIVNSQIINNEKIVIYDVNSDLLDKRSKEFNIAKASNNKNLTQLAKYIIIAVKPQVIEDVLNEIGGLITDEQTIISIAAGISIDKINHFVNKNRGIIRVMPNTPALVGAGASALAHNENVSDNELAYVKKLLQSIGIVVELEEKHISDSLL